jgi:D-glycero-D-manno-heptose 1,7-bisphosphate phosphatase
MGLLQNTKKIKKPKMTFKIDTSWTLFLDRDGVINIKLENDYVKNTKEFEFQQNTLLAIKTLASLFSRIVIVTNQRGISRQIMSEQNLHTVHTHMLEHITASGGKIDQIYFCPHSTESKCNCRKPNIGMGLKAKKDFPDINFNKSIMVGDSVSDIIFGKKLNMVTIYINPNLNNPENANFVFKSLYDFSIFLTQKMQLKFT